MNKKFPSQDGKPIIGITIGDMNGIGPEIILKVLDNNKMLRFCTPVIYGSMKIISKYRKLLKMNDWFINQVTHVQQISPKKTNLVACLSDKDLEIDPGRVSEEAGKFALESLIHGVKDLKEGYLDALLTAPINKHNIQHKDFRFPGHTEYLAETFEVKEHLMLMVAEELRVGLVTGHIPVKEVSEQISQEKITRKVLLLSKSLKEDFNIGKPKIAVLGLNPHAGEEGLLGEEEQKIIRPAIIDLKKKGELVFGPYPADGFFASRHYQKFDGVLAMYHDQGLTPFKTIAFQTGVNFTAGLPVVRASPDHGTAYDIAGKGIADESSFLSALFLACDVVRNRRIAEVE